MPARTLRIIEHPGYFETIDTVYNIEPGTYTFEVKNRSNKDSGFVLSREYEKPIVIMIKNAETGTVEVDLKSGDYSYFCPIIPTPVYTIRVK